MRAFDHEKLEVYVLTRLSAERAEELRAGRTLLIRVVSTLIRMAQRGPQRTHAPW